MALDSQPEQVIGVFADSRERLRRFEWLGARGAHMLAEELYTMFGEQFKVHGPMIVNNTNPAAPGITVIQNTTEGHPPFAEVPIDLGGTDYEPPVPPLDDDPATDDEMPPNQPAPEEQEGGGGTAGTIVSNSGTTATVTLVTGETVTAAIGQLASGENAAGIKVILTKVQDAYYTTLSVWQ